MPRALVTGSNGHIGANLVRDLLEHGWEVVPLVRAGSDTRGLDGLGLTLARGDVLDGDSVAAAARGCDVVFHAGAPYRTWARRDEEILDPLVRGTENVVRAAKAAGARRVVYTSSCNTVGFSPDPARPITGTQTGPYPTPGGAMPPTGKRVSFRECHVLRLRDGRIASAHVYFDMANILAQLGLM